MALKNKAILYQGIHDFGDLKYYSTQTARRGRVRYWAVANTFDCKVKANDTQ